MIWPALLLLVGLVLVIAEVLFPSLGLLGLLAGLCIVGADWMAFTISPAYGWTLIALELVLVPLLVREAFKRLPNTGVGKRMYLAGPATETGPAVPDLAHLRGAVGEAATDLRPAGTARIEGARHSVVADDGFVEAGRPIQVVAVEGTAVHVRALPDAAPTPSATPPASAASEETA